MTSADMRRPNVLACAIAALLAGGMTAGSANAQQAQEATGQAGVLEEIQVTGSRITRTGMTTPVPVTAVTGDELKVLDPGNLIESLSQLPQFLNSSTAQQRGTYLGPGGQSFLNIRGMGQSRTLVLLDGRRIVPSDRLSSVDINQFPEAMIQTVEVVTGGASAAYGADALAGVANFILNRQFTGFDARAQGGMSQYGDGENWQVNLAGGFPVGDRIHVIASGEAYAINEIQGRIAGLDRRGTGLVEDGGWFHRWGWVTNPAWSPNDPPGTNPQRLTLPEVHSTQFSPGGIINQPGFAYNRHTFLADGTATRPFIPGEIAAVNTGTLSTSGGPEYYAAHLGQREDLIAETKRRNMFASASYDLSDSTDIFLQGIFGRSESHFHHRNGGLGPSLMGIWHATIFQDNAFLPEHIRQAMIDEGRESFRMDKGGFIIGRDNFQDDHTDGSVVTQLSLTTGLESTLPNGWGMNAHYQYGRSKKRIVLWNQLRVDRMFLAMDAVVDPETGGIICNVQRYNPTREQLQEAVADVLVPSPQGLRGIASPVGLDNTIENCVPLNVFGHGNVSPEAAAYVVTNKWSDSNVDQHFAEVLVTGDVHEGWGAGAIGFAGGATYRRESFDQNTFPSDVQELGPARNAPELGIRGISPGFTGGAPNLNQFSDLPIFSGGFNVWEAFAEALVPLYAGVGNGRRVDLSLAARYAQYSRAGGVWAWKTGLDLQVTNDLRVRGTYSADTREGTFAEMFDQQGGGGSVNDPRFNNQAFSISSVQGGNPDVAPEEARTLTFGFVYQPSWLSGMQLAADYYDIDLSGAIGQLGLQRIVDECEAGTVSLCANVVRDPNTGFVTRVFNYFMNISEARTRGVDMELVYRATPNLFASQSESLTFRALGGYLRERSTTPLGGVTLNEAGAGSTPNWTTLASVNYDLGPWSMSLQHRFIQSVKRMATWTEGVEVDINRVASATYANLRLSYTHDVGAGSLEYFGHVSNLFDRTPPMFASAPGRGLPGGTGVSSLHDQIGRRFVVGARVRY